MVVIPDVSIVIPVHNRFRLVEQAIVSCLDAGGVSREIIVVDDGSEGDSERALAPVRALAENRQVGFRLVVQGQRGACAARNRGLEMACGRYVKFLDSDDLILSERLAGEVAEADRQGVDAFVSAWLETECDGDGVVRKSWRRDAPDLGDGIDAMLMGRAPCTHAALYRRDMVRTLRWDETLGKAQDWDWAWTVCLAGARFGRWNESAVVYRHFPFLARVSRSRDAFNRSADARQYILRKVETALRGSGRLTPERAGVLARYLTRDAKGLCERDIAAWRELHRHCLALCPAYRLWDTDGLTRGMVLCFGRFNGIRAAVGVRRLARRMLGRTSCGDVVGKSRQSV